MESFEELRELWEKLSPSCRAHVLGILRPLAGMQRTKRRAKPKPAPAWAEELALLLQSEIQKMSGVVQGNVQTWARDIDLLHRQDQASIADIRAAILWATSDDFWKANIRSGKALRKQFSRLIVGARKQSQDDFSNRLAAVKRRVG